jgi:hypothetical protein
VAGVLDVLENGKTKEENKRIEMIKESNEIRAMAKSVERTKSVVCVVRTKTKTRHSNFVAMHDTTREDNTTRMKTTVRAYDAFGLVGRCCSLLTWTMCWTLMGSSMIFAVVRRDFPRPWRLFPRFCGDESCWGDGCE